MTEDPKGLPHEVSSGTAVIAGVTIRVVVLSDGQRVIPEEDFKKLMDLFQKEPGVLTDEVARQIAELVHSPN